MRKLRWNLVLVTVVAIVFVSSSSVSGLLVDLASHWAAPLVAALEAKGYLAGDALGRYEPEGPLTRAQMAKLVVLSLGHEAEANLLSRYDSRFSDIPSWHWGKGFVESLAESAITDGIGHDQFGPAEPVTRAQMAVFLVRAAGLAEQARLRSFEPTRFADDAALPDWARGSVGLAQSLGLMTGFADRTFRPGQPITRAEGASAILRLEEYRGAAYHLSGTLVQFDPATRQGVVRDALGNERRFVMSAGAPYYRAGIAVTGQQLSRLDQVWIVRNAGGEGVFLEARYADLLGYNPSVSGQALRVELPDGSARTLSVQRGALVFLNGRKAALQQVDGAQDLYLALDEMTGEARVVDAVKASLRGTVAGVNPARAQIFVYAEGGYQTYSMDAEALVFLNGERAELQRLQVGDRVRIAQDQGGRVTYVQAER